MANVGYATLTIIPSAKGFSKALNGEVGGSLAAVGTSGGKAAGKHFGGGFIPAMKGFFGPAVGIAAGLGLGKGIASGLETASFMEQAKISFETLLGSGGDAQKMLTNLSSFAAKTPFELPGLVANTRSLLGAGAAAESVIPTMGALGDTAGALGLSQDNLNSVVRAWTQMMGKGKVQAEEMLQISEAGIPIWPLLAEAMGKPIPEIQKMASEGKLLASDVLPLLESQMNKNYGGSMEKQAKTLAGVWSTVKDTVNMALADALMPLVPVLTTILPPAANALATAIRGVSTGIQFLVTAVGPHIQAFIGHVQALFAAGSAGGTAFNGLLESLRPLGEILVGNVLPALQQLGAAIITGVQPVLAVLGNIITGSIIPAFQNMAAMAAPLFTQLGQTISVVAAQIGPILSGLASLIQNVWGFIGPFVIGIVQSIFQNVVGAFQGILTVIQGVVNLVAAIFAGDWAAAWNALKQIVSGAIQAVWNILQLWLFGRVIGLVRGALSAVRGIFTGAWNGIVSLVSGVGARLGGIVRGFMDSIRLRAMYGMDAVRGFFTGAWNAVVALVRSAGSRIGSTVSSFIGRVRGVVSGGLNAVRSLFSSIWNSAVSIVSSAFGRIVSAVSSGVSRVMGFVSSLPGRIIGALGSLGGRLYSVGTQMIAGLANGIRNAAGMIRDAVASAIGNVVDFAKGLLGIHSPSRVFMEIGNFTSEGMAIGIEKGAKKVQAAAKHLVPEVPAFKSPSLPASAPGGILGALGTLTGAAKTEINLHGIQGNPNEFGDALTFALHRARRGGVYA